MRKFKLLLSVMLSAMAWTGTTAQTVVTDVSQLSNTKVYTIECPRGTFVLNNDQNAIVSSHKSNGTVVNDAAATDDPSTKFCIIQSDGLYYIYSPKLKKFAGVIGQVLSFNANRHVGFEITTDGTDGLEGSVFRLKAPKFNFYANNNNSGNIVVNSYSTAEGGNTITIKEAGASTVDEQELLASLRTEYLDDHKVYKINNVRVTTWTADANGTGLTGTKAYPGASEAYQQFAFITRDGKEYMYNLGTKKFVGLDGDNVILTTDKSKFTPVEYIELNNDTYGYEFMLPEKNWYFNGQGGGGFVINGWANEDDGNRNQLVEVNQVNVYDEMLDFFEAPYWDVTYNVYMNGEKIHSTVVNSKRNVAAELPAADQRPYLTYTYDTSVIETGVTEVNVTATWTGPFEISTDFANAHWYDMAMRSKWYVTSAAKDANDGDAYITQNANTMGLVEDSYQWAFIGNPYAGFQIINKAEGQGKSFGWTDAQATNAGIPTIMDDAEGKHAWNIVPSTNTTVPAGSFVLNVPGTNLYINQFGGEGGKVKFWNSANNLGDAGSAFTVFDVPTNFASFVAEEIAPYIESTGYFTFTDAAKATIGYDEAYKTECPFETYKALKQKLTEAQATTANYILPETGYYILKNKYYGTYMGIDPSDANMYGNYNTAVAAKQIVKLTKTGADTYTVSLMDKFAPATVAQSAAVTATTEAGTYIVVPQNGTAAFRANSNEVYSCLHCDAKGKIVGWEAAATASQWEVIDAESIEFTIGAEGYATAYLPFPAEFGGTIPLPEPKGVWTFDDANDLLAGTGIATLKATTHAKNNVTETDLATAGITTVDGPYDGNGAVNIPVGSSLLMSANTNATNIGTYTIMYDVCVEDGSTYVPLLQNSLTDGKDGSLFINKNQVGLGGGLGYHGTIENNKWYRIVFAVQPNGASLYVDGVQLVSNLNLPNPYNQHWQLTTGALFFADEDGEEKAIKTSEVRFWDTVLSADQIADLGSVTGDAPKFPEAVGSWTFDDATDPYATTGTATLSEWGNGAITATDGEVTVPVGAGLELKTNLDNIPNAYTLLLDVKFAAVNSYAAVFQNDITNGKDASIFVKDGAIGLNSAGLGYKGTINADTWYRIVTVIDDGYCTLYVDGEQVGKSAGKDVNAWTMRDTKELMLFTDDSGEEKEVTTSEVRFWNTALTASQIAQLGTVGTTIDDENDKPDYEEPTAYTAVIGEAGSKKWLTLNKVEGTIPTKTAVVIKGTPRTYLYKIAAETAPVDNNDLKGTLEPIEATGKYILAKPGKEVGFYLAESGTIAACKAYIELTGNTGPLVKALLFNAEDETAISNVNANGNGNNAAIYNMAGQRISKLQKGVNIVNGKKILK